MSTSELDLLGQVDYLVVEFPADKANFSGAVAKELASLVERDLIRVLDLVILRKDEDGSIDVAELDEVEEGDVGEILGLEADLAFLLAEQDIEDVASALAPGSIAAVVVWENRWSAPFGAAVRNAGGQLVADGRIPTQALLAAVEAENEEQGA